MTSIAGLWQETASEFEYIDVHADTMNGEPCIAGTRIPVSIILSLLGEDLSFTNVILEYDALSNQAISQALLFAARLCYHTELLEYEVFERYEGE